MAFEWIFKNAEEEKGSWGNLKGFVWGRKGDCFYLNEIKGLKSINLLTNTNKLMF